MRKKWIEALRSGNYQQGRGMLKGPLGYCCLGVLCEISGMGTWFDSYYYEIEDERSGAVLPVKLREKIGLSAEQQTNLIGMNDSGDTFLEIADWIEALR